MLHKGDLMAKTLVERVRASQQRAIEAGYRRIGIMAPPDVVDALDALIEAGYGDSRSAVIYRAVLEASRRIKKPHKPVK